MSDPRDLTALAAVKSWLNLTATSDDALLTSLVTAVSVAIETYLGRAIVSGDVTETRDGTGQRSMVFAVSPVTAVASVTIGGMTIPAAPDGCSPGYVFTPTRLSLRGYRFTPGLGNVVLSYTAGYGAVPPDLAQAATELVALRYRQRDRIGLGSHALAGETASFLAAEMPADVTAVLARYRKMTPL